MLHRRPTVTSPSVAPSSPRGRAAGPPFWRDIAGGLLASLWVVTSWGGCSTPMRAAPDTLETMPHAVYPDASERGDDMTIIVVPRAAMIEVQNMSARRVGGEQIWLNRSYVSTIDGLAIGGHVSLPLDRFRNRYGEIYPRGSLLAPERNEPIVLAELFNPATGHRHRLIVRMGRD